MHTRTFGSQHPSSAQCVCLAGSYSAYALVKEDWAVPAPKNLSLETEAGAVPLVSLTAYQVGSAQTLRVTGGTQQGHHD